MNGGDKSERSADTSPAPEVLTALELPDAGECLRAASRDPLAARLHHGLRRAGLEIGSPVLLLVSGGADSMALLALVTALWRRVKDGLQRVHVLTFDHGLRPEASDEAALVVRVATHLGVGEVWSERLTVSTRGNILANARAARLAATEAACRVRALSMVLLGHHADDRAESVLLALTRGASLEAVASLVPRREMEAHSLTLVRPLLDVRRGELRTLLTHLELPWCEDPSNALRTRGAMRRDGIGPEALGAMSSSIGSFCDEAQEVLSLRDTMAQQILAASLHGLVPRALLDAAHPAVRRAVLLGLLRAHGKTLARSRIQSALLSIENDDHSPHLAVCDDESALLIDRRGARVLERGASRLENDDVAASPERSLRGQTLATEAIRDAGHDTPLDLEHHRCSNNPIGTDRE